MFTRIIIALVVVVVAFAIIGADTAPPTIKNVPPTLTSPASGKQMFETYCAVCHGKDAKGDGPASAALRVPPADLTQLAEKNGGKFPELRVYNMIHGDIENPAHGSREMPMWGNVFQSMSRDNGAGVQMRVANLTAYIRSLQGK